MTAPAATACRACDGEGVLVVRTSVEVIEVPCARCSCAICGRPTSTPPICLRCDTIDDASHRRRADR